MTNLKAALGLALTLSVTLAAQKQKNECDPAWVQATFVHMGCLYFEPELRLSWDMAGQYCQDEHNATLVEIEDTDQFDVVQMNLEMLAEHEGGAQYWWTAATDSSREGRWVWMATLASVGSFIWAEGSPDPAVAAYNCLSIKPTNHGATDSMCTSEYKPICQKL
jgi:hypothetical protein